MSKIDTEISNEVEEKFGWENLLNKYKVSIIVALFGLILIGAGVLIFQTSKQETKIEIISSPTQTEKQTIFVDIEGSVEKPGVYELDKEARVEELLVVSGGLSASADRDWVSKSLNRAQKLVDGAKIFIPEKGEVVLGKTSSTSQKVVTETNVSTTVNLNTASTSQLEALWGIGPVTAQKIIEGRPYQSPEELLSRKIVKSNVYERIKDQLTVF